MAKPSTDLQFDARRWVTPPVAEQIPFVVRSPNGDRTDEYYWMREDGPGAKRREIMEYLKAENEYAAAMFARVKPLHELLVAEMRSRIEEDESSVPVYDNGYWYWRRFEVGAEYPALLRQCGSTKGPDCTGLVETILDVPTLALGRPYFRLGGVAVSPNHRWLAWTEDITGRRTNLLRFKNLETDEVLTEEIPGVLESIVWANDNLTVFYIKQDPQALHTGPVYRHTLWTDPAADPFVYSEGDDTQFTSLTRSSSRKYVLIVVGGYDTTEHWVIPADSPATAPIVILPRISGVRSYADHLNGRWIIRTNESAPNFRLVEAPEGTPADRAEWKDLVSARNDVAIEGFALFNGAIAIEERVDANKRVRVLRADGNSFLALTADETAYTVSLEISPDPGSHFVRVTYTSMITPDCTFDVNVSTGERVLRKQLRVIGYERGSYTTQRVWVPGRDDERIPVSLAYRTLCFEPDGSAPLYISGYGSYGYSSDPSFSRDRVSLLDRGFVVATAHVRGGAELGQGWYEDGKLLRKRNTFNDFIDVTDFLVNARYCGGDSVFASGASAGGLLMGAVANEAGMKFRGIAMHVPFVDIVTTMLDESIPLTTNEWNQWGNPHESRFYEYLLSYSPYDNIAARPYPPMIITAGLCDAQVQYYEPAKYVARLRSRKTDSNPLLFFINLDAGHGGKSGRLEKLTEIAREYAFFLDLADIREKRCQAPASPSFAG